MSRDRRRSATYPATIRSNLRNNRFDRAMRPHDVIDKIARGDVFVVTLTFPEGLTIAEMAKIFESHGLGPAAAFVEAAQDADPSFDLGTALRARIEDGSIADVKAP